jgi:dTDP-4-amino-4,6-dideoxygalactose transaminase
LVYYFDSDYINNADHVSTQGQIQTLGRTKTHGSGTSELTEKRCAVLQMTLDQIEQITVAKKEVAVLYFSSFMCPVARCKLL